MWRPVQHWMYMNVQSTRRQVVHKSRKDLVAERSDRMYMLRPMGLSIHHYVAGVVFPSYSWERETIINSRTFFWVLGYKHQQSVGFVILVWLGAGGGPVFGFLSFRWVVSVRQVTRGWTESTVNCMAGSVLPSSFVYFSRGSQSFCLFLFSQFHCFYSTWKLISVMVQFYASNFSSVLHSLGFLSACFVLGIIRRKVCNYWVVLWENETQSLTFMVDRKM